MTFVSTQEPNGPEYGLAQALRLGPAPDGGLFMPTKLEPLSAATLARLRHADLAEIATSVLTHLLAKDLSRDNLRGVVEQALDFEIPLRQITDRLAVLEIFHGPTLAFKDVGARCLARLLAATRSDATRSDATRSGATSTILVATSGDTGGAVAQAFHGVEGTRVAILYPEGKVSPVQERQFTTLGDNVLAFAVDGTFDDCQRLVNEAFADRDLAARVNLTSANSINVGRLLPQIVYYFHAAAQANQLGHERLVFCTPSGNFGNLTAGLMAKRLGLSCRFVAATNANDVVPFYLQSGRFEPRPSTKTISNAMDVGRPNNFVRILHLYQGDLDAIRRDITGYSRTDAETRCTIARVYEQTDYLLDPHTAVGWSALEQELKNDEDSFGIVLGTAHPAKFGEVVAPAIGKQVPLPEALACHLDKEVKSKPLAPSLAPLKQALLDRPT